MPMEADERLLKRKGLHQAVMFHDFAGRGARGSIFMGVAQLRLVRCVCVQSRPGQLARRAFVSPAVTLLPHPRRHPRGRKLAGKMTWARAYIKAGELWMDIGRGEVVKLPEPVRDQWWEGTTRQWPFMAADMASRATR